MKIVFLDRDGVINEFPGNGNYVTKLKSLQFLPGSLDAIRYLTEEGYKIFVISNQAGVGKGVYTKKKLNLINNKLIKSVQAAGGWITKVYYCIHPSDADCECRKPQTGNFERAIQSVNKRLHSVKGYFFVGDTKSDVLAGFNAKLRTILVLSGRANRREVKKWGIKPDYIVKNLKAATRIITTHKKKNKDSVDKSLLKKYEYKKNGRLTPRLEL